MNFNTNAQSVNLNSTTNPHAWFLKDFKNVPQNGLKVMTTFSCGGGSSLGYRLAGCDVMSVPPKMMQTVAEAVIAQWFQCYNQFKLSPKIMTKTSQITQSETLEEPVEEIKPEGEAAEQPKTETSELAETAQEEPTSQPEPTKLEEAQPAEEVSE